jgi:hypothetical protein
VRAREAFGEATNDRRLLEYADEHGHLLITHDKKDFAGRLSDAVEHAGIVVYTDANFLRDDPEGAVRTLDRVFDQYPPGELTNEIVWLDQWHR